MDSNQEPRGIRNKNPGNIRINSTLWEGEASPNTDGTFLQFIQPVYGLRAIVKTIRTYIAKDGCVTFADVVNRWAPPSENDTGAYVTAVCEACGTEAGEAVQSQDMPGIIKAIVQHENGMQPYSDDLINQAIAMAGEA